jgi:hypothetical protein
VKTSSVPSSASSDESIDGEAFGTGVEEEDLSGSADITEPFDPSKIRVETKSTTIDLLLTRMKEGEIDLAPDFQRKASLWKPAAKSRLIESILIRIPLPAFYMDATDDDRWLVVDGLQRLSTLREFALEKTLRLTGLEFLQLNGSGFDKLPRHLQRRIRETQVTVYLIERGTPPEVKFNVFKRINTGGLPLSAQEIRHALNQGPASELLKTLADTREFGLATANGISDERMADRECVLRFIAFFLTAPGAYRGQDFDGFLNQTMARLNDMSDLERQRISEDFLRSMRSARAIFDEVAFRKPSPRRKPINKPLFEAWSVNLARRTDAEIELLIARKKVIRERFGEIMDVYEFEQSVSVATGDARKVALRFSYVSKLLDEALSL